MFRVSLLAAAVLSIAAVSSPVYAQEQAPGEQQQSRQRDRQRGVAILQAIDELDLTPEQKEKIQPIREVLQTRMQAARDLQPEQRREELRLAMDDARTKLQAVLTPEQQTRLRELMAARQAEQGGPLQRIQQGIQQLDLTPEQREKVRALAEEYRPRFQELRELAAGDRATTQEKSRAMVQEFTSKVSELLTPEQKQKLDEYVSQQRQERQGAGQRRTRGEGRRGDGAQKTAPKDAPAGDAQ